MTAQAIPVDFEEPMMEMNTTPLIDVLLVLLIMFIITIPLQTHAVKIDLPVGPGVVVDTTSNKVVVDQGGTISWNGQPVDLPTLSDALTRANALASPPELHLQPDAFAPYQRVDEVLAVTKRVGVEKMGFVGNEKFREF
jgi:biopolymer transport protein ExbD